MSTGWIVFIVVVVILAAIIVALILLGRKAQKRQEEQQAQLDAMKQTMLLLERLLTSVPLYRLGCRPGLDAAKIAYETMGGRKHEA